MATLEVIRAKDPERIDEWNRAQDPEKGGYLFSRSGWLETLASALDCGWSLYICRAGDEIAGGALILEEGRSGGARAAMTSPLPLFSLHVLPRESLSPARRVPEEVAVLTALAARVRKTFGNLALDLPPTLHDVRALSWAGWRVEPRFAFALDLPHAESPPTVRAERDMSRSEDMLVRLAEERGYGCRYIVEAGSARVPVRLFSDAARVYPVILPGSKGRLERQQRIDFVRGLAKLPEAEGKKEMLLVGAPWEEWFGCGRIDPLRLVTWARASCRREAAS